MTWKPINPEDYQVHHNNDAWTPGAIECYESGRDCKACSASKITEGRLSKNSFDSYHCQMPGVVQRLLNRGSLPNAETPQKPEDRGVVKHKTSIEEKRRILAEIREIIARFVAEKGPVSRRDIAAHLNEVAFQGHRVWHIENTRQQVDRLINGGVIRALDNDGDRGAVYEILDSSKLSEIISYQAPKKRGPALSVSPSSSEFSQGRKVR